MTMHTGTVISDLERLVERVQRHSHKCFRCHATYECCYQRTVCGIPTTIQEEAEYLCEECQAILDDEEL